MKEITHYREKVCVFFGAEKSVALIQVIRTELSKRGEGTEEDPIRLIIQYWSLDGELLAEVDEFQKEATK